MTKLRGNLQTVVLAIIAVLILIAVYVSLASAAGPSRFAGRVTDQYGRGIQYARVLGRADRCGQDESADPTEYWSVTNTFGYYTLAMPSICLDFTARVHSAKRFDVSLFSPSVHVWSFGYATYREVTGDFVYAP